MRELFSQLCYRHGRTLNFLIPLKKSAFPNYGMTNANDLPVVIFLSVKGHCGELGLPQPDTLDSICGTKWQTIQVVLESVKDLEALKGQLIDDTKHTGLLYRGDGHLIGCV